jgi:hypothetical protein
MIKRFFILSFIFAILNCSAQLINTNPVEISVGPCNFNSSVVKQNKIKKIELVIVDKPDGSIIIDRGATQGYEFDTIGRLTRYYYTILNKTESEEVDVPAVRKKGRIVEPATTKKVFKYFNDTISATILYDSLDRVIAKRIKTGDYFEAFYYEYNEHGDIKKELHCKETNVSENKKEFKLGVQTILSSETFEYTALTPTQIKKRCLNDEGREYKKVIINYDSKGNKLSESSEFIVSWMHEDQIFQYDGNGKLKEQTHTSNQSGNVKEQFLFENAVTGFVLSEKKLKNDVLLTEASYLYDETNNLVKSQVSRDHKNASIGIIKYAYTFY